MKKHVSAALILLLSLSVVGCAREAEKPAPPVASPPAADGEKPAEKLVYRNADYGFEIALPDSWKGYQVLQAKWEGVAIRDAATVATGPLISIRHPSWTAQNPRQDIPIQVFTMAQWNSLQAGEFHIGAAPIGPKELGRNANYVFALPARYNFAFPTGYEEVEQILAGNPLKATSK